MCGIAGIFDPAGVSAAEIRRMTDAIAHRGPDDATLHVEPGIGLGFRRLAIIDLVTGRQPIANEDESVWVILNGEIYNYRALRDGLVARGHRFRTQSDTEVLVHLYEELGAGMVKEIRGMFAFAIWDRRRQSLLIGRDHLGQKPLYWAQKGPRLFFGSEIKAILAAAPEFRVVDPVALDEYLTLRIIADPRSMFQGIHKLPPAHLLEVDAKGPRLSRYWGLDFEPKSRVNEKDAVEELDHRLGQAVKLHLESDVPVGAFLSGGVDSGLVLGLMKRVGDQPVDTFTVGMPYGEYDERPAARLVADRYGTRHHEEAIGGDLLSLLPRLVHHLDEPSDPLSAGMYHLAAMTRRHVKVALGGDGGDELFGGYDRYYGVSYVRHYAKLPGPVRRLVSRHILSRAPEGFWYKSLSHRLRWMDQLAEVDGGRRYARALSYFYFTPKLRGALYSDRFERAVQSHDAEAGVMAWYNEANLAEAVDRMLQADTMVRLPNHSVMILDRMTMAHGLEARSPFLDHEIMQFCATLPARLKVRGRKRRLIEMKLAERYLPAEVLRRPKQGLSSALPYLMKTQFSGAFRSLLRDSQLVEAGWLQGQEINRLLDQHLGGHADHGNRLWLLLNAEIWHRLMIGGSTIEELNTSLAGINSGGPAAPSGRPVRASTGSPALPQEPNRAVIA